MDSTKMTQEMFELFKASLEMAWNTTRLVQGQTEKMASMMIDQSATLQAEGRKQLETWMVEAKKRQEELKKFYDEGVERFGETLGKKDK